MAKEDKNSEIIEHGDLFFFYRPKNDAKEVKDVEDVQRFYMVTASEKDGKATANKQVYRLFLIGQKQMPEIVGDKTNSKERNWALIHYQLAILKIYAKNFFLQNILQKQGAHEELGVRVPAGEGKYSVRTHIIS